LDIHLRAGGAGKSRHVQKQFATVLNYDEKSRREHVSVKVQIASLDTQETRDSRTPPCASAELFDTQKYSACNLCAKLAGQGIRTAFVP